MSSSTISSPDSRGRRLRNLVIVGQLHPGARHSEALGDAEEYVLGDDPATVDDFGDFGLGLAGQLGDLSMADVSLGEQPVDGGDVPLGERSAVGVSACRSRSLRACMADAGLLGGVGPPWSACRSRGSRCVTGLSGPA
jgi:hypothetical protein